MPKGPVVASPPLRPYMCLLRSRQMSATPALLSCMVLLQQLCERIPVCCRMQSLQARTLKLRRNPASFDTESKCGGAADDHDQISIVTSGHLAYYNTDEPIFFNLLFKRNSCECCLRTRWRYYLPLNFLSCLVVSASSRTKLLELAMLLRTQHQPECWTMWVNETESDWWPNQLCCDDPRGS